MGGFEQKDNVWGKRKSTNKRYEYMQVKRIDNPFTKRKSTTQHKLEVKRSFNGMVKPIVPKNLDLVRKETVKKSKVKEVVKKQRESRNVLKTTQSVPKLPKIMSLSALESSPQNLPIYESAQRLTKHNKKQPSKGYAEVTPSVRISFNYI